MVRQCPMCRYGDLRLGERCEMVSEPITVFMNGWSRITKQFVPNSRTIIVMKLRPLSFVHTMQGGKRGRADRVFVTNFWGKPGCEDNDVLVCDTQGETMYIKGLESEMDIEIAQKRMKPSWYPGIYFYFNL